MFANACEVARGFTRPVITSIRLANGECHAIIGTFIVINEDGWIATAHHIIEGIAKNQAGIQQYQTLVSQRQAIENDANIKSGEKHRRLKGIPIPNTAITNEATWWGMPGVSLQNGFSVPEVDLFVGQLVGFDRTQIRNYPTFKNPSEAMRPGKSLCKMGYPFLPINPTFDTATSTFGLPALAFAPPEFPIEGIFTRKIPRPLNATIQPPRVFPLTWLETSSPGIPGQSGGPTFDTDGVIWAIQSSTASLGLNFENSSVSQKQNEFLKNQYLHVGLGVHTETIIPFLVENGISFQMTGV